MEYGLIGKKLGHSYSKDIHEALMDYTYQLREIAPDQLADFFRKREFKAINVTAPYKQDVIPLIDEIDKRAQAIGAVNTVVNRNGHLVGYNTDFDGVLALLSHMGLSLKDKKVLILGTGGTSHTVKAVCEYLQAASIKKVSRSGKEGSLTYQQAQQEQDVQILFNTTPVGMYPDNGSQPIDLAGFKQLEGVVDVVYNPIVTQLVLQARSLGIKAEGGLYMLVAQAVRAIEHFKDVGLDDSLIEAQYRRLLADKLNIVLIGMPGAGKSTISQLLAEKTGRECVELDRLVERRADKRIAEIFAEGGEPLFRILEREVTAEAAKQAGRIISTGGGVVLDGRNITALKQTGILFYLQRDVEKLAITHERPLSRSLEENQRRFAERKDKYEAAADYVIDNNGLLSESVAQIKEVLDEISGN